MIRRGRGGSQEETGSDQTPAASRGSLPGMSRVCCPILAVILLAGFTAHSSPAPPSPSPAPCAAPEYRQFDFWLGDWNVYNPAGALVGTNRVTREFDGCVLQEHWVAAGTSPQRGSSFNTWSPGARKWHQTWVDSTGGFLLLDGEVSIWVGSLPFTAYRRESDGNKCGSVRSGGSRRA